MDMMLWDVGNTLNITSYTHRCQRKREEFIDIRAASEQFLYSCLIYAASPCFTTFVLSSATGQALHKCIDELCGIPQDNSEQLSITIIELQSPKTAASFNRMA